jgi:hypothetical protein
MDHWADPWADYSVTKKDNGNERIWRGDTVGVENVINGRISSHGHENKPTSPWADSTWNSPWMEESSADNIPEPTYHDEWTKSTSTEKCDSNDEPNKLVPNDSNYVGKAEPTDGDSDFSAALSDDSGSLSPTSVRRDFKTKATPTARRGHERAEGWNESHEVLSYQIPATSNESDVGLSTGDRRFVEAKEEPRVLIIPDSVDVSLIDKLFGLFPSTTLLDNPDEPNDPVLSSVSSRRTWYRLTRHETLRQHNGGSSDESYVRVTWNASGIRKTLLDSLTQTHGKNELNSMWPEPLKSSLYQSSIAEHESPPTKDAGKELAKNDDIPSFQFSWSSDAVQDKATPLEATFEPTSLEENSANTSLGTGNDPSNSKLEESAEESRWDFEVFENLTSSIEPALPIITPPPGVSKEVRESDESDDEWGEMVHSPEAEVENEVDSSKVVLDDAPQSNANSPLFSQTISQPLPKPKLSEKIQGDEVNSTNPSLSTKLTEISPISPINTRGNLPRPTSYARISARNRGLPSQPSQSDNTLRDDGLAISEVINHGKERQNRKAEARDAEVLRIINGLSSLDYMVR